MTDLVDTEWHSEAITWIGRRHTTTDAFAGALTPRVVVLFSGIVRSGFNAMALAPKERAGADVHSWRALPQRPRRATPAGLYRAPRRSRG